MRCIVTTYPFGNPNPAPVKLLNAYNIEFSLNIAERKYNREEHHKILRDSNPEVIIAGTERYDAETLDLCPNLKIISRVGIGLDSVDIEECKKRGIIVTYTPDAPSNAVAELTICQMINMLRHVQTVGNANVDNWDKWQRFIGRDIRDCEIGIIGMGRIGSLVLEKLQGLKPRRVFVNDIIEDRMMNRPRSEPATKQQILQSCDVVTIHIPLEDGTVDFITKDELSLIKKDAVLINLSRGGIVNEDDLAAHLALNEDFTAALDAYCEEPYAGKLVAQTNAYLTPHLGSCTQKSRYGMEVGAAEEVVRYFEGNEFNNRVI